MESIARSWPKEFLFKIKYARHLCSSSCRKALCKVAPTPNKKAILVSHHTSYDSHKCQTSSPARCIRCIQRDIQSLLWFVMSQSLEYELRLVFCCFFKFASLKMRPNKHIHQSEEPVTLYKLSYMRQTAKGEHINKERFFLLKRFSVMGDVVVQRQLLIQLHHKDEMITKSRLGTVVNSFVE